ncbi:MAG: putative unusual protein kinase regulating ubiquinone biosynthesis (AarF/ABC1/UbiB family) [Myxococcota bacterium]|jgi:predicted unusual protein kinase regulating ubiquinone biosynthesis (AarF/ABC1/UbiB family)
MGLLGRRAIPMALKRLKETVDASGKTGSDTDSESSGLSEKLFKKHSDVAEKAFKTLGELKGVALKMGQMLSYMDGAIPQEYQAVYQDVLTRLQSEAPSLPWESVRPILEAELGDIETRFASIEETPFAAASIGQVHRAVLPDGTLVAVKVQYPGVDKAMASDLKNAALFQTMMSPALSMMGAKKATKSYMKEVMSEIQARLMEELDYEREARMQMRFRALLADDPDVVVPEVFAEWSTGKVLTSALIDAKPLSHVVEHADQETRDKYATTLTRAMLTLMHRHHLFNADPHPGNYLFFEDGRVCLLDFGCVKEIPDWMHTEMTAYLKAGVRASQTEDPDDWAAFDRALGKALRLDGAEPAMVAYFREFSLYIMRPALTEGPFDFTTAYARESFDRVMEGTRETVFGKGKMPRVPKIPEVPADYTFLNRLQWGFYSILTMLKARVDWRAQYPAEMWSAEAEQWP